MEILENLKKNLIVTALAVLFLVTLVGMIYFRLQLNTLKTNPQKVAEEEISSVVAKVSELMVLPEGETPNMLTVTDPAQLKDQPFFAKAEAGDKVLIYTTAQKAILYSVGKGKILEVAPLNIGPAR